MKEGFDNSPSVVITVKNEKYSIKALLDSLEKQTFSPKEIIFVDGGSVDGTTQFIQERMKINKKIKLIKSEEISIAEGRNSGISKATEEIIAITDAGCVLDKNWLLYITQPLLKRRGIGIVAGSYKMIGRTLFQEAVKPYLGIPFKLMTSSNFLPSTRSIAFRKSVWKKIGGFSEKLERTGEDTLFNYRAIRKGINFHFEKKAIVNWKIPKELGETFRKFYYYAKGDAQTMIWWHPKKRFSTHNLKIMAIYIRYLVGLILFVTAIIWPISLKILIFLVLLYLIWAAVKNLNRVEKKLAIILSPFVQVMSDVAIMFGFFSGVFTKK